MIGSGFRLLWGGPRPSRLRRPPPSRLLADASAQAALDGEVVALQEKGAVERVCLSSSPGYYGRLFVVPKRTGGWRPVLDLSPLNVHLRKIRFRMETPASLRTAIRPSDWASSIDLTDAYFHLLFHPRDRCWLRFVWRGQVFQFRALPFCLSQSPWVFTAVVKVLVAAARRQGVRIRAYLDDWLVLARERAECVRHTAIVLSLAARLGFTVNSAKSELTPSQRFVYLGMDIDTVAWCLRPAPARVERVVAELKELRSASVASVRSAGSTWLRVVFSHRVLVGIWLLWFAPLVDLLAARSNHRLTAFGPEVPVGRERASMPWSSPGQG